MIRVQMTEDPQRKTDITRQIMHSLPKWFSPPEDIEQKSLTHRGYPFFEATRGDAVLGFLCLKIHNSSTAEIFTIGVLEEVHRSGLGHELLQAAENYLIESNFSFLTVKTLDSSANYEPYDRTRSFYAKEDFLPIEVFLTYWNEDNPCLLLAKALASKLG